MMIRFSRTRVTKQLECISVKGPTMWNAVSAVIVQQCVTSLTMFDRTTVLSHCQALYYADYVL